MAESRLIGAALYAPIGVAAFAVGLAWVGWSMWREPALDIHGRSGPGPLAPACGAP